MRLSISNIGWSSDYDEEMYVRLQNMNYQGLEIAPTRIFPDAPYSRLKEASAFSKDLQTKYALVIPSIQSIWYGHTERIWGEKTEREFLLDYTRQAIDFAVALGSNNLVFGCPKNRNMPDNADMDVAFEFFYQLGEYAHGKGTCIGFEANPPVYNTNFINTTKDAIEFIRKVGSEGLKLNLDVGTMICNDEGLDVLDHNENLINHVHISEPGLSVIVKRDMHRSLKDLLDDIRYSGFVSIEMGSKVSVDEIIEAMAYVESIFR